MKVIDTRLIIKEKINRIGFIKFLVILLGLCLKKIIFQDLKDVTEFSDGKAKNKLRVSY